jgi:F-type H+-transporting ATPase subunit delta
MTTDVSAVAGQYAKAIMQLAAESSADKTVLENLRSVKEVLHLNPDFATVLRHPAVSPAEKKQLIVSVFGGKVHELALRLLEMLADRRRLELIPHIEVECEKLWLERQNIAIGTLFYAEPPDARALAEIKERLQEKLGKTIELSEKEDKSLIGGFMLRVGDQIIDGSLKGRLQAIEKQLLSV